MSYLLNRLEWSWSIHQLFLIDWYSTNGDRRLEFLANLRLLLFLILSNYSSVVFNKGRFVYLDMRFIHLFFNRLFLLNWLDQNKNCSTMFLMICWEKFILVPPCVPVPIWWMEKDSIVDRDYNYLLFYRLVDYLTGLCWLLSSCLADWDSI